MGLIKFASRIIESTFFSRDRPVAVSIDVTNRCNLRCKHCYFINQEHNSELSDKEMFNQLKELKSKYPLIHATWIGGEPLLRKELVEEGIKLFPFNMVITNGTIPLPNWRNCVFNVSVDGTKEYHEKVRGNNYDKVKKNVNRDDIKVNLICVLSRLNVGCIEDMVDEWSQTKVNGIVFDFFTPRKGKDKEICLTASEREEVIDRLVHLKRKYENFLLPSYDLLNRLRPKNAKKVVQSCNMPRDVYSIDPSGNRKLPCVMGEEADCSKCGCLIPYTRAELPFFQRLVLYKDLLKMYTQYL